MSGTFIDFKKSTPADKRVRLIFKSHKKQLKRFGKNYLFRYASVCTILGEILSFIVDNFYLLLITSCQKQAVFICQSFTCELLTRK